MCGKSSVTQTCVSSCNLTRSDVGQSYFSAASISVKLADWQSSAGCVSVSDHSLQDLSQNTFFLLCASNFIRSHLAVEILSIRQTRVL